MSTALGEVIILAGGFGTRLRQVVSDVPKPMAPMDEKGTPFLAFVMHRLALQGIRRVVLSVGYMAGIIQQYFGDSLEGMSIEYVFEESPLGTGGAAKKALGVCQGDSVFVINGDTFLDVPLAELKQLHERTAADFTLAARDMWQFDRYGALLLDENDRVIRFCEKQYCEHGYINGGVYCVKQIMVDNMQAEAFSLEKDFLEINTKQLRIYAFKTNGYFIDIGIPDDYRLAREDLFNVE